MIAVATTRTRIEGYCIAAYKGTARETFAALLRNAETLGANAILNTCFDDALGVETLYHGAAVVITPLLGSAEFRSRLQGRLVWNSVRDRTSDSVKLPSEAKESA